MVTKKKIIVGGGGLAGIKLVGKLDEKFFDVVLIHEILNWKWM